MAGSDLKNPLSSSLSSDKESDDREDGTDGVEEAHPPQDGEQERRDQQEELELDGLHLDGLFEECPNLDANDEEESQGPQSEQTSTARYSLCGHSGVRPPKRFAH